MLRTHLSKVSGSKKISTKTLFASSIDQLRVESPWRTEWAAADDFGPIKIFRSMIALLPSLGHNVTRVAVAAAVSRRR